MTDVSASSLAAGWDLGRNTGKYRNKSRTAREETAGVAPKSIAAPLKEEISGRYEHWSAPRCRQAWGLQGRASAMRAGAPGGQGRSMNQIRADQRLSFVRPRKKQRVVSLAATPQAVDIDVATTALLVVDMQNDFCHPEGWFAAKGIDASPIAAVLPMIERLTSASRAAGIPVLWLNWGVRADRANLPRLTLAKGRAGGTPTYGDRSPSGRGRILVRDDWGAAIVDDLTVDASDIVVHKHRISGFWDNELDSVLRQQGITTLLFAGINIDRCVFSTLQDANFLGYDCILVEDACATVSPDFVRDAVIFLVRQLHGVVAKSDALLSAIGKPGPAPLPLEPAGP
jgi:ureidoacrylate peracid hydrolase